MPLIFRARRRRVLNETDFLRRDPVEDELVYGLRALHLQEVAGAGDDPHPRLAREVPDGVADETDVDATVAVSVQVKGGLGTDDVGW
jgi:hypothetical protein